MKKDYIKPTAEVILLDLEDVRMKISQGSQVITGRETKVGQQGNGSHADISDK